MTEKDTKELIIDKAEELFLTKGFDNTSMSDIQDQSGVARGTLYYHFKSKEKIMDAVIERESEKIFDQSRKIAKDKSIPAVDRLKGLLKALNKNSENEEMMNHLHNPQNALMHEKVNKKILDEIAPLFAEIIEDGNKEGTFHAPYPLETVEMLILYVNYIFDHSFNFLDEKSQKRKMEAFQHNLNLLLGANFSIEDLFFNQGSYHEKK